MGVFDIVSPAYWEKAREKNLTKKKALLETKLHNKNLRKEIAELEKQLAQ